MFSPNVTQVLIFLAKELQRVRSYSTLNTTRSAISLISNDQIGNHPLVKRFCKGASTVKPSAPRYDLVWDPEPVIIKLAALHPISALTLEELTKKLALLLALATGHRTQTLSLIKRPQITNLPGNKIVIRIPDRIKTSAQGRAQPSFQFSCFANKESLCVVHLIREYISRTKDLKQKDEDNLFISYNRPHKSVGVQTISRWIRDSLKNCGVDVGIFTSHSTRHASTSLAAKKGVSTDLIKRAASWTGASRVFANFYNRPIVNPEAFSRTVLSV